MLLTKMIESEWIQISDWRGLRPSGGTDEYDEYSEADFDNFVEIRFREFAETIGLKYKYVKDILYGYNIAFFQLKSRIFSEYDSIDQSMDEYKQLTTKLFIPSLYYLNAFNTVDMFFRIFDQLKIQHKIEVLEKLSKATISIPTGNNMRNNGEISQSFLNQFSELSQVDKCRVLQRLFGSEVKINIELK